MPVTDPWITAYHPQNALLMLFIRCTRAVCPGLSLPQVHLLHAGCAFGDEEEFSTFAGRLRAGVTGPYTYRSCMLSWTAQMRYLLNDFASRLRDKRTTLSGSFFSLRYDLIALRRSHCSLRTVFPYRSARRYSRDNFKSARVNYYGLRAPAYPRLRSPC